jgi:hypothetical protein
MTENTLDALKGVVRGKTVWSLADYYNIRYLISRVILCPTN